MDKKAIRCAIYTRKSSEEGLEQDYNSLDAQRDSCEAYIKSQRHEGWKLLTKHYDDGGYSGGSMNRPAFQELLNDIKQNKIDIVVVYKVDRLTRSLMDFSKIIEIFDNHGTSFVSITQQFNTTTSMGRLTLNILLSFAQFEREVTGERIRDKFAASAKKGLWITGATPLGYKNDKGCLIEDKEHSWKIKKIFEEYVKTKSVRKLKHYLDDNNILTRSGKLFSKGNLYHILSNKVYIGKIIKGKNIYDGQHQGIISEELFETVQSTLKDNLPYEPTKLLKKNSNALLQGKLFDCYGNYMSPTKSSGRGSQVYKYYINQAYKQDIPRKKDLIKRIPASPIESFIQEKVEEYIKNPNSIRELFKDYDLKTQADYVLIGKNLNLTSKVIRDCIYKVIIQQESLELYLSQNSIRGLFTENVEECNEEITKLTYDLKVPQINTRGKALILAPNTTWKPTLIEAITKGFYYTERILSGDESPELNTRNCRRLRKLRFLPPDLISQILEGKQDPTLTIEKLLSYC